VSSNQKERFVVSAYRLLFTAYRLQFGVSQATQGVGIEAAAYFRIVFHCEIGE
jgi:hypothetical protein